MHIKTFVPILFVGANAKRFSRGTILVAQSVVGDDGKYGMGRLPRYIWLLPDAVPRDAGW